jgi:hypothetical protein
MTCKYMTEGRHSCRLLDLGIRRKSIVFYGALPLYTREESCALCAPENVLLGIELGPSNTIGHSYNELSWILTRNKYRMLNGKSKLDFLFWTLQIFKYYTWAFESMGYSASWQRSETWAFRSRIQTGSHSYNTLWQIWCSQAGYDKRPSTC